MNDLSKERIRLLAEEKGWSVACAEGFIDGENYRRRSTTPSKYAQVGIDDYCLGFRAGYYGRDNAVPMRSGKPNVPIRLRRSTGRS